MPQIYLSTHLHFINYNNRESNYQPQNNFDKQRGCWCFQNTQIGSIRHMY